MNFCTLFNLSFLSRGIALYLSLIRHAPNAKLYVYCFDRLTHELLIHLQLDGVVPIALSEFESPELILLKARRTFAEYCWTCTPHVIRHALEKFKLPAVTYLDADLYFYASPDLLLDEWSEAGGSVLITEHRYTPRYDHATRFGTFCVQFMSFRADPEGREALDWWAARCLEWCFARVEDGKFGDQKYIDDWPTRFRGVHVLRHLGGGVAPWNVQQYEVVAANDVSVELRQLIGGARFPLVFYHFHGFEIFRDGEINLSAYLLGQGFRVEVYGRYIDGLREAASLISSRAPEVNFHGLRERPTEIMDRLRAFKRRWGLRLSGALNVLHVRDLVQLR